MRIIVQKFGGTSVATPERREQVARRVRASVDQGYRSVVVVSAMGREGDPYATDTLLRLATEAYPNAEERDLDLLLSCGEIISAVVLANTLRRHGLSAAVLTGAQAGIITDDRFANAQILRVDPSRALQCLEEHETVVVAGFQGITENGEITTLGRGGSDTSAAAMGVALGAEVVEIYTDVDGVKTADPRLVPEAQTLDVMAHYEVAQMAAHGAKVIHPAAVELAMRNNLPLRIRSTFADGPGTLIITRLEDPLRWPPYYGGRVVTAVTHLPNVTQVVVRTEESASDNQAALEIFDRLAAANVSVDLINVFPGMKAFTVADAVAEKAADVLEELGYAPRARRSCAKVTVVGMGMRGVPGVMARVVRALTEAKAPILQTSDSHVTISCLVPQDSLVPAVRALHRYFGLDRTSAQPKGGRVPAGYPPKVGPGRTAGGPTAAGAAEAAAGKTGDPPAGEAGPGQAGAADGGKPQQA